MKLSVSDLAWPIEKEDEALSILKEHNIRGIEITPSKRWPDARHASENSIIAEREKWSELSIQIVSMQSLLFGHPELTLFEEEQSREQLGDYLRSLIKIANNLKCPRLVFGSPKNRIKGALSIEQATTLATELFREIGNFAAKHEVVLCIEPNPAAYGCDWITTGAEALDLVKEIGSPGIKLQLDSGALRMSSENSLEFVQAARDHIGHVHISAPHLKSPTSDEESIESFIAALNSIQYSGWASLEMLPQKDQSLADYLGRSIDFLRKSIEF